MAIKMEYEVESYSQIIDEFKEILPEFFEEVDIYPEKPEPNIDT